MRSLETKLFKQHTPITNTEARLVGDREQLTGADEIMPTNDVQLAKLNAEYEIMSSRVVDLQREVDRLRRKMLALGDIVALAQAREEEAILLRNEKESELLRIMSTRGYRLLNCVYYRLYESRYIGTALHAIRLFLGSLLKRIRDR